MLKNAVDARFSSIEERFTNMEAMMHKLMELHASSLSKRAADVTDKNVVAVSRNATTGAGSIKVVATDLGQRAGKGVVTSPRFGVEKNIGMGLWDGPSLHGSPLRWEV